MRYLNAALVCTLVLLAGCGGGDSERSSSSTTSAQAQGAPQSENAEESIEGFGEEATGSERDKLLAIFHGYLGAIASEDGKKTCAYLSARVLETLQQLARGAKKSFSCEKLLKALLSPEADEIAKSQSEGEVRKIRFEGDTAFVVFHAPGARLYQLNLVKEGGEWKVSLLSAAVLAPELPR